MSTAYNQLLSKLKQSIQKQQDLEAQLTTIEQNIYNSETEYLSNSGNIITGFDNMSNSSRSRRHSYTNDDRIFSLSSSTYVRHLQKTEEIANGDDNPNDVDDGDE